MYYLNQRCPIKIPKWPHKTILAIRHKKPSNLVSIWVSKKSLINIKNKNITRDILAHNIAIKSYCVKKIILSDKFHLSDVS